MNKIIVGLMLMVTGFFANAMEFKVMQYTDTGGTYILANGPIEPGDSASFEQFLINNPLPIGTDVLLYSGGGSIWAAQSMAIQIRNAGFNTWVPAGYQCWSACTDMFLGGNERTAQGIMAYHAASLTEEQMEDMTGQEILQLGQTIGINDLVFAVLMVTEGKEWKVAVLYRTIHAQPDTSVFYKPSPEQLFAAGITTQL